MALEEAILKPQRFEELKVAQKKQLAFELQEHKVVFAVELVDIHREIKALQTRTDDIELSSVSPICDQHENIITSFIKGSAKNGIHYPYDANDASI